MSSPLVSGSIHKHEFGERGTSSAKGVPVSKTELAPGSSSTSTPPNYSELNPLETRSDLNKTKLASADTPNSHDDGPLGISTGWVSNSSSHLFSPSAQQNRSSNTPAYERSSSYSQNLPSVLSNAQVVSTQPSPMENMVPQITGSRNARKRPVDLRGKRDWNSGLCGCNAGDDHEMDICCKACFCPCIIFGRNKARIDHLANHNSPEPTGEMNGGGCAVHGIMTSLSLLGGCVMQIPLRATIRDRYSIAGSCFGDCCTSIFCYPCALTQEYIEISAEEHSFPRGVGGSSGIYYDDPKRYRA
ncbi:PLAC8 family-domain-containing protein [Lentinula aff. detonsa]|uniref:PLAC8 family-domain-containing protein n=1 Tax=Lentinula aff. detonsa TaxID=2804958 RepID=A0AA38KW60_9AGAR|nr:PLAC8 family-domain-containing protein [Lentinula aff. detonsa]